jgi:beta-galactosidase
MKKVAQSNQEMAPETKVEFDDSAWGPVDVRADIGPLGLHERAFYRTHFNVEAKDLASPAVEIVFSRIAGGVAVYVNGHKVGGGADPRSAAVYDVKALLHPGENVVAVPIENYGPEGAGVSKGVVLRLTEDPPALHWSRSVFNGLAQVIVQSTGEPGSVTLRATSEGLQPGSLEVKAMPAAPRPSVP